MMAPEQDDRAAAAGQPHAADFAAVEETVRAHAAGFAERGFELTVVRSEDSALLPTRVFHFANTAAGLRLDLAFFPAANGLNGGFNILIIKPVNRKLDVEDYLARRGRGDISRAFTYRTSGIDMRRFADTAVRTLLDLFDTELKAVLDGETFEETPIDWQGYK
jgi:hypothetical protein